MVPQAAKIAEENGFGDVISYIQGKAEREWAQWLWLSPILMDDQCFSHEKWSPPTAGMVYQTHPNGIPTRWGLRQRTHWKIVMYPAKICKDCDFIVCGFMLSKFITYTTRFYRIDMYIHG